MDCARGAVVYKVLTHDVVAVVVSGIVGFEECPGNSNAIIVYLLLGGSLVGVFIVVRSLPSLMTCFRNRNYLNTGESNTFTSCICVLEIAFYVLAVVNFIILILGTVWIFQDTSLPSCSSERAVDCCTSYVYVVSAFFNVFQYIMYAISAIYVCLVATCIRKMDKVYGRR